MTSKIRSAAIKRKTKETDISGKLLIDGAGKADIDTGIGFLDHMLTLFAYHGLFDLDVNVKKQDLDVDIHHTNEDVGIVLGEAFQKALKNKLGIKRFGTAEVPMDEALAKVIIDISGRGSSNYISVSTQKGRLSKKPEEGYDLNDTQEFLRAFANNAGITLTYSIESGENLHHSLEAIFKALGRALREACEIDPRRKGIPSTKGKL